MRGSTRLSDAVHILSYIAVFAGSGTVSSEVIASSVETNPTNVRKIMGQLRIGGLITTVNGRPSASLARKPERISLYDIYRCVDADVPLIEVDHNTNPRCVIGANIQLALERSYAQLQNSAEREMKKITLRDILRNISTSEVSKRPENREVVAAFL